VKLISKCTNCEQKVFTEISGANVRGLYFKWTCPECKKVNEVDIK